MAKSYWLMKSEPNVFSITDLKGSPGKTCYWDGVRNYKARNYMRDEMKVGDGVLFYHSRVDPAVVGTAKVVSKGYPDHTAWDPASPYYDAKSGPDNPVWYMVDIQFQSEFARPLALAELRKVRALKNMVLLRKGVRLSVQPVTAEEFRTILGLARRVSK
ncbi:MAG: EVE domain-containing protein [Candidatus Krumholzibacteria bacterium]|nr:EVE domain-containing protein [Candidatus Krumholzibacteria bacterium]